MKKLLAIIGLLAFTFFALSQGPILRQFGTTNTGPVLTNIIVSLAGGSSQTPWLQAINGNGFDLLSVADQTNTGTIQAAGFVGDGAGLTNLNGTEIRSGTVADARIASTIARDSEVLDATNGLAGALGTAAFSNSVSFLRAGVSVLDGSGLTNLNGTEIRSGTVADARIASTIARDTEVVDATNGLANALGTLAYSNAAVLAGYSLISSLGTAAYSNSVSFLRAGVSVLDGSGVTNLNGSEIRSGTVPTARLGSGTANSTTFLRGDQTWATPAGGSQTPWTSDIDADTFDLFDLGNLNAIGTNFVGGGIWVTNKPIVVLGLADSQQIILSPNGIGSFADGATTIGENISIGTSHSLNADGSAQLANGNIVFDGGGQFTNAAWAGTAERYLQVLSDGAVRAVNSTNSGGGGLIKSTIYGGAINAAISTGSRWYLISGEVTTTGNFGTAVQVSSLLPIGGYLTNFQVWSSVSWPSTTNIVFTVQTNTGLTAPVNTPITCTLAPSVGGTTYTNSGTAKLDLPTSQHGAGWTWVLNANVTSPSGAPAAQGLYWSIDWYHNP